MVHLLRRDVVDGGPRGHFHDVRRVLRLVAPDVRALRALDPLLALRVLRHPRRGPVRLLGLAFHH